MLNMLKLPNFKIFQNIFIDILRNMFYDMDKKEIKEVIEWCDEKGHTEHEILELIRRIVGANPREEEES